MWKRENLRKNFLRVKQIADQNLGRAEKSEVLTEDLQFNEKRVDGVKQVCHNLIKKVTTLLESPPGTDHEKRLKKLPETSLSHTLMESASLLGQDSLLGNICQQCGECESVLAKEELQCELEIEREVLTPLQVIEEIDIPGIMKLRKQLSKSTLDMDSAKSRFNSAVRQSHVPGANMATASAKADAVRDEYDEACNKVETIKDNLSIELCNFISKECEHSARLIALLEAQAKYHKSALKAIEEAIPKMKSTIDASTCKPVFGMPLEAHLSLTERDISVVLEACIRTLLDIGMEEEGLFRIAGSALKMKKLKASFDAQMEDMDEFITDPHCVAGVLKQYLRELPEPMLTYDFYAEFMQASQLGHEQKCQALYTTLSKIPPSNYNNFRYLVKFLAFLAEKSHKNKMTPSNIAIVMGPNLLWARGENTPNMLTAGNISSIIETFIKHADYFFPGVKRSTPVGYTPLDAQQEIEFAVTKIFQPDDSPATEMAIQENLSTMPSSPLQPQQSAATYLMSSGFGSGGDVGSVVGGSSPSVLVDSSTSASASSLYPTLPTLDSVDGAGGASPKVPRRLTKKPAPRPPPGERPSPGPNIAAAGRASGNSGSFQIGGHLSTSENPPQSSTSQLGNGEKRQPNTDRPHVPPPERPRAGPPERPKAPMAMTQSGNHLPAASTSGHQRSASTGAMYITTNAGPNPGSASQENLQADGAGSAALTVSQGSSSMPSGTATLGRHSTMRPARPQPPPPPPPINRSTEDTHL